MISASVKESDKVVDLLLARGADVNQTSTHSRTPLHSLSTLTNHTPDNNGQVDSLSISLFLSLYLYLSISLSLYIYIYIYVPILCLTMVQTVLHFLASKSNLDLARKLVEEIKPPASTRVRDKRGQYPIHRAAAVGSVPMINLLLKHRSPLNATDNAGYTALHHAVAEGHGK